jgi:hypothetical protein
MPHFYEKNIVEIKNEYTRFLINIMRPFIYEGFVAMYLQAQKSEQAYVEKEKTNPGIKNPGIFKLFQLILRDVPELNNNFIDEESRRIKERGKCSDFFDDLVRAVVKSFIVLLTFNASGKKCKVVNERFHENVNIRMFVHKCYIECARIFFNRPELFWHKYSSIDTKKNQREAYHLIGEGIEEAVRKLLPVRLILEEYLSKDYIYSESNKPSETEKRSKYSSIKNMVNRDLYGKGLNAFQSTSTQSSISEESNNSKQVGSASNGEKTAQSIVESSDEEDSSVESNSMENKRNNVDELNYENLLLGGDKSEHISEASQKSEIKSNKSESKVNKNPKISENKLKITQDNKISESKLKITQDNKISETKKASDQKDNKGQPKIVTVDKKMIDQLKNFINNDKK